MEKWLDFQTNDLRRRSCYSAGDDSARLLKSRETKTKISYSMCQHLQFPDKSLVSSPILLHVSQKNGGGNDTPTSQMWIYFNI